MPNRHGTTLKDRWNKMINDLKPMTFKERVEYMWMYYKEYLVILFMVVIMGGMLINAAIYRSKEIMVTGMMINVEIEQQGVNYLTNEYMTHLGGTPEKNIIELDHTRISTIYDPGEAEAMYNMMMLLPARVTGGLLDYILLDQVALEHYIQQDIFMDLREVFTPEEMAQWEAEGRIIYGQHEDDIEKIPYAIVITDIPFVKDNVEVENQIYFALAGSSPRPEMCRNAWEYINAWESKAE